MILAEVVETKYAFKSGQKDDVGNPLPVGSIQVRIGAASSNLGQVRNIFARPAVFNRRIPLIGEQVLLFSAPVNDWSTTSNKGIGFCYLAPVNSTDDVTLHSFWQIWRRKGLASTSGNAGQRLSDKEKPGYSFKAKKVDFLQPFEGDDVHEGRFGQSIRFGSTIQGDTSIYEKKPSWKGTGNGDPLMILRVNSQTGAGNKYTVEDISKDDSSIYLTSKQSISNLKGGFDKNLDVKQIGNWMQGSQAIVDADRLIINARKDMLFLIGAKQATLTGKKVLFQSDKYKVDLDELMEFLKKWLDLDQALSAGTAVYSTASGPTSTASNMADYLKLKTADFLKFKQP